MGGKTIGLTMNNGWAGSYARQPDMIINTRVNSGEAPITFGDALIVDATTGGVKKADTTSTSALFAGIASRQVQSQTSYLTQDNGGQFQPQDAVAVFQRGRINVLCKQGNPKAYGKVYLRKTAGESGKLVGDLEAVADLDTTVELTNCQWGGEKDANGVAELVILYAVNA